MDNEYDVLKIENQVCFPLYACAKEVVKLYKPHLDPLDLTYTQYIAMMILWEQEEITVKKLGERLYLDSGTLTPVLKKLEVKGYLTRERSKTDERNLNVRLTAEGVKLKERAVNIPMQIGQCVHLSPEEGITLYQLLYKVLGNMGAH